MTGIALIGLAIAAFVAPREPLAEGNAPVAGQALRLAVLSSEETRATGELLTAELSHVPAIELVERDELRRAVAEEDLSTSLGAGDWRETGRLLNAAGLVVLSREPINGLTGTVARLVAVNAGVVLGVLSVPEAGSSLPDQAGLLRRQLALLLPKLRTFEQDHTIPVSVVGLRFELELPEADSVERQLNPPPVPPTGRPAGRRGARTVASARCGVGEAALIGRNASFLERRVSVGRVDRKGRDSVGCQGAFAGSRKARTDVD